MKTLTVLLVLAAIAPRFGHLHFALDLFSHFKVHYLLAFLFFGVVFFVTKSYLWAAVSLAGALFHLVDIAQWYHRDVNDRLNDTDSSIKVLLSNVQLHNRDASRLLELVSRELPDIVGLVEVNQSWIGELAPMREEFPFHVESPSEVYRGLALYSKFPIEQSAIMDFGQTLAPTIVADITAGDSTFQILLTHPVPPMTTDWARQRNDQLNGIASYIRDAEDPVILIGDLNITMWDRTYASMVSESQLINARAGASVGPTWPAISLIGIPIDHILVTEPSRTGEFRVHDSIGSDHFPVSARVAVHPRAESSSATTISQYLDENHDKNEDAVTAVDSK